MKGRPIEIWSSVEITEYHGRYRVWQTDEKNYGREPKPEGFGTEKEARDYAERIARISAVPPAL